MLPALREYADVVLWTDQAEWESSLEKSVPVRCYKTNQVPWEDLNRGDVSVFNIGNNAFFHGALWYVSQRHPGIVILHDRAFQGFSLEIYRDRLQDRKGYLDKMAIYYGQQGREYATMAWDGRVTPDEAGEKFPLTPLVLEGARGVIVHTPGAFRDLKGENRWPVLYVEDAEPYRKIGEAGRVTPDEQKRLMEHAQLIIRFAEKVCRFHHPVTADYLTARCAAEMAVWSKTTVLQNAMSKAAQQIMELCNAAPKGNRS
jgi:hypothetical protein